MEAEAEADPVQRPSLPCLVNSVTRSTDAQSSARTGCSLLLGAQLTTTFPEELKPIRTIIHESTSTAQFARGAYEVFYHQNTFLTASQALPDFVNCRIINLKPRIFRCQRRGRLLRGHDSREVLIPSRSAGRTLEYSCMQSQHSTPGT